MTFTNSILSGNKLVREAITSENFDVGVAGWTIERDGNAEFNEVVIRGDITVGDFLRVIGSDPDAVIEISASGGSPVIDVSTTDGTNYQIRGSSSNALQIGPVSDPNARSFWVDGEGIVLGRSSLTGAPSVLFDDDTGFLRMGSFSPWTENGWTTLTGVNGWTGTVQCKILPHGEVVFRGSLGGGTNTVGTELVSDLAVQFRPPMTHRFQAPQGTNNTTDGRIQIDASGNVVIAAQAGTASYWFDMVRYQLF